LFQLVNMPFGDSITIKYTALDLLLFLAGVAACILFVGWLCCCGS